MNIDQQINALQTQIGSLSASLCVVQAALKSLQSQQDTDREVQQRAKADEALGKAWGLRFETAENGKMYLAGIGQGIEAGARQATRVDAHLDPAWVRRDDGTYEIKAEDLLRIILGCSLGPGA